MIGSTTDRVAAISLGAAIVLQGVLLVRLGGLHGRSALQLALVAVMLGWAVAEAWRRRDQLNHHIDMALVMGGFGGLGMIAGTWLDLALAPATAVAECGCAGGPSSTLWRSLWSFMTIGMLVAGVPPSFWLTRCARLARQDWRRWVATHVVGNLAMVAGMIAAGRVAGQALGRLAGSSVVGAHLAMLGGMVAGMVAGMWLGETVLGLRPWRDLPRAVQGEP